MKHPGYEKLFFCEEDLKGLCEKCLDLHQSHKIYTIALQSRQCRKEFKEFASSFVEVKQRWDGFYKMLESRVQQDIHQEIHKMENEITSMFNKILSQIEEMKKKYQKEYQNKADEIYSGFNQVFGEYVGQMKVMSQVENKLKQMEQLYNLNDFDVIKEYLIRKD